MKKLRCNFCETTTYKPYDESGFMRGEAVKNGIKLVVIACPKHGDEAYKKIESFLVQKTVSGDR